MNIRLVTRVVLAGLLLTACASPSANAPVGSAPVAPAAPAPAPQRTLVMMAHEVPVNFAAKALAGAGASTGLAYNIPATIFNATLALADERGQATPYLAETLPSLNSDTWRVAADGTMETTYKLRPNLTWHDGQPLTAEDFVFAWQVYATPEYGVDRSIPIRYLSEVVAPDRLTLTFRWRQRWADAGVLQANLPPLPRHLLEPEHRENGGAGERFLPNSQFWTTNYVGAGPYKLDSYNPSVSIEASAFEGHALGRAKINRVSIRGVNDINAAVAVMLAGDAHYAADMFRGEEGLVLERAWGTNGGTVLWELLGSRGLDFQFRPERAQPLEIATDVRVRRAIAHALDKEALFTAVSAGHGIASDTFTHKNLDYFAQVDREAMKHPHDPRRTQALLEEANFTRSSDGRWITPRGEPFDLPIWFTGGSSFFQQENAIIVDQLKRVGISATSNLWGTQSTERRDRALLPGIITGSAGGEYGFLGYSIAEIPTEANRWAGGNRGAYASPDLDRMIRTFDGTLDPSERTNLIVQMEKVMGTELGSIFLYYHARVYAHIGGLKGVKNRLVGWAGTSPRNIHEWEWSF